MASSGNSQGEGAVTTLRVHDTRTTTAQCLCKSVHFSLTLPISALPIATHICHCSLCRYTHGTMCIAHAPLPRNIHPNFIAPSSLDLSATRPDYRKKGSPIYFCSTCGCHLGCHDEGEDTWYIAIALFPRDDSLFTISRHIFTQSAPAGLHDWLPQVGDRQLSVWNPTDESAQPSIPLPEMGDDGLERLRAECHCGGVSFSIPRPNSNIIKDRLLGSLVSPVDKTKWKASIDACNDCRLISGVHVNAWAYLPLSLCETSDGSNVLDNGTLKSYNSSSGHTRGFCGGCGATVLFWSKERQTGRHDGIICIAVGIFRAPEGVRADSWLTWRTEEIGWLDAGRDYDEDFYTSLNEGLRKWGMNRDGKLLDFELIPRQGSAAAANDGR